MRALATAALVLLALGCDGPPPVTPEEDGGVSFGIASTAQIVAWEGQTRFVTVLTGQDGEPLEGATVEVADPSGPLQIVEQRCAEQCAVVLRILDQAPNTGDAIPPPIAGKDALLNVRIPNAAPQRALLRVMPLDTITGGGAEPIAVGGVRLASSAAMTPGTTFVGRPAGEPIRWVIFGDAVFGGTIDVSASGVTAGPGGYDGGDAGGDGRGPGGGGAGASGAGAGGGGHATEGAAGAGPGGEAGGGGAGGPLDGAYCALDFFADFGCGGSGGGGAEGEGGGGGGTLAIVSLATLDLEDATLRSVGGDGAGNGGGGAGGAIALAAPSLRAPTVELTGGAGDGHGGAGGDGVLEVQAPDDAPAGARAGPAVDLESVPAIVDQSLLTLEGRAAPDAQVTVEIVDGASVQGVADSTGAFSIAVELSPGLNRLRVVQDGTVRSWVGTSIELESREAGSPRPVGALIDVAYLP